MQPNTNSTTFISDGQYKDNSPVDTVARIKDILRIHSIETEEKWNPTNVPYCYAMSVKIPGTIFSVNGKGLTPEFALASGYGELMERLQMGHVNGGNGKLDGDFAQEADLLEKASAAELLNRNRKWYELLSEQLYKRTGIKMTAEQIISQYPEKDGTISAIPYFDLTTGTKELLPVRLCKRVYTTNGSAAGNSPEEALVQAISEIVERNHQIRIITENLTLPDIPEEVIQKYAAANSIIQYVRSKGYRVIIKDASLGTRFPVVCACFINEQTGRYHTHFGAYPVFEIALERAMTETFQGRNIDNFCKYEDFIPGKKDPHEFAGLFNEMMLGNWKKTADFFSGTPRYPYDPSAGFDGTNNKELLRQCISHFRQMGLNVLVRDSSCLGFCTYQVLIPGYSEMFAHRICVNKDDHRYASYAAKTLRNPSKASMQDMLGLLMHLEQLKAIPSNLSGMHGFSAISKLPAKLSKQEDDFLMSASLAYVYYALGKHSDTIRCIDAMIPRSDNVPYLICLKQYLTLLQAGYQQEQIRHILNLFHTHQTVEQLFHCLLNKQNPIDQFIVHCDMGCSNHCPLAASCCHKRSLELGALLSEKMTELDFETFSHIMKELI